MAASHGGDRPKGAPSPVTRNREDQDNAIARLQVFMLTTRQRCGELFCIRIICEKYVRAAIYKGFNVRGYFLTLTARPGAHKPSELQRTLSTSNCVITCLVGSVGRGWLLIRICVITCFRMPFWLQGILGVHPKEFLIFGLDRGLFP